MSEDKGAQQTQEITEPMIVIGRTATGQCVVQTGMNPAAAVVLLERMKIAMVHQFHFDRQQLVQPATGPIPPMNTRAN